MSVGTTTTSKVRAVVTALYTALVTRPGLTGVQVFRYAPNQTAIQGREYVALATTITGEQSYPFAGNSVKQDDFTLSGEIWTAIPLAGDDAADEAMERAEALYGEIEDELRTNATLDGAVGGGGVAQMSDYEHVYGADDTGRTHLLRFRVVVRARMTS